MSVLIGLALATVLAIGWAYGNILAVVFLTLGELLLGAAFTVGAPGKLEILGTTVVLVAITWAPYSARRLRRST